MASVAEVAYGMWEARGRPFGDDWTDWFAAERQLRVTATGPLTVPSATFPSPVRPSPTWAERVELASEAQRRSMGFGPFLVNEGTLVTMLDSIVRPPRGAKGLPEPWPVAPAPGWLTQRLDDDWSIQAWCGLGGEWVFQAPVPNKKRVIHVPPTLPTEHQVRIAKRLDAPIRLLASGEAFSFCDGLFVLPAESFDMNSWEYHVPNREPLGVFLGFRGHVHQYPEIVTPGVYRAHKHPTDESIQRYQRRARVAANLVKQAVFERENIVLSNVQARGVLQHYQVIGDTDVLDLSYDVNVAKWFALNAWDRTAGLYRRKSFVEHTDPNKAYDEHSIVYTVVVRTIGTLLDPDVFEDVTKFGQVSVRPWGAPDARVVTHRCPPRNLSPLWSTRAARQSGFGLVGIGPKDNDAWGSVLSICEHAFHPKFSPNGWDRIGGPSLTLAGTRYSWDADTSGLSAHTLPEADESIRWIEAQFRELEARLHL